MMLLTKDKIKAITKWWKTTKEVNGIMYDRIIIAYNENVMSSFPFKRFKYGYFHDTYGYTIDTIASVEYLELYNQLSTAQELLNINSKLLAG